MEKIKNYNITQININNIYFLDTYLQVNKKTKIENECVICLEKNKSHFLHCNKCKHHYHINCLSDYFNSCQDNKCCYCKNSENFTFI